MINNFLFCSMAIKTNLDLKNTKTSNLGGEQMKVVPCGGKLGKVVKGKVKKKHNILNQKMIQILTYIETTIKKQNNNI